MTLHVCYVIQLILNSFFLVEVLVVNLSVYTPCRHTGRVVVLFNSFLTLPLDGGEWSASQSGHFTPMKGATSIHCIRGLSYTTASLDDLEKTQNSHCCWVLDPVLSISQPSPLSPKHFCLQTL